MIMAMNENKNVNEVYETYIGQDKYYEVMFKEDAAINRYCSREDFDKRCNVVKYVNDGSYVLVERKFVRWTELEVWDRCEEVDDVVAVVPVESVRWIGVGGEEESGREIKCNNEKPCRKMRFLFFVF